MENSTWKFPKARMMKKVYAAQNVILVGRLKNALKARGIDCILKNADLHGGIKVSTNRPNLPELWIVDDTQLLLANRLLDNVLIKELNQTEPWTCVNCGQELESAFSDCWNCGAPSDVVMPLDEEDDEDEAEEEE